MSLKLNEAHLIQEVIENIPVKDVELIVTNLSEKIVQKLLVIISSILETSRHLEYYLCWVQHILTIQGPKINATRNMPALLALEKSLLRKNEQLSKICDYNKYTLQYIINLGNFQERKPVEKMDTDEGENSESEDDLFIYDK